MGQYQQWLHYQEIDRRLRAEVEALEAESARLQECLDLIEQQQQEAAPLLDNPIMQALFANLSAYHASPKSTAQQMNVQTSPSLSDMQLSEPGESISPALLSWGGLPNLGLLGIEEPFPPAKQSLPPTNHPEIELLPEDMVAFFDEHAQTDPQLELPWWLRNIAISSKDEQRSRPIDQHSIRTNRLVQRWIERWGREPSTSLKLTEQKEEGTHE